MSFYAINQDQEKNDRMTNAKNAIMKAFLYLKLLCNFFLFFSIFLMYV